MLLRLPWPLEAPVPQISPEVVSRPWRAGMSVHACLSPQRLGAASWAFLEVAEAVGGAVLPRLGL